MNLDALGLADPSFPPLLSGQRVDGGRAPVAAALAAIGEGGGEAGDIYWSTREDMAHLAVILEPDMAAGEALAMVPLAMVAAGDSIGAVGPPNLAITFGWPNQLIANGAVFGSVSMVFPGASKAQDHAQMAVLELQLRLTWPDGGGGLPEPGELGGETVLHEEGCGDLDRTILIDSWSRHFLTWVDTWERDGFRPVHENWLYRAQVREGAVRVRANGHEWQGEMSGLDEHGGLLLKSASGMQLATLAEAMLPALAGSAMQGTAQMNGGGQTGRGEGAP